MKIAVSAWAIRRPIPTVLLFLILTVLGVVSFRGLPITRFPNIDLPLVSVVVTQSGANPSELETQVTKRVEDAVAGVAGVKHVRSTLTDGSSVTTVEFRLETNQDRALNDVKDAVSRIRAELPRTVDEPIVSRIDIAGLPIVTYAASAPQMPLVDLSYYVDDVVARALQGVRGVASVERVGGVDREVQVELDPDRLAALGTTAGSVNAQLRATNVDLAGGRGEVGGREQSIRTLAGARTVADLAATPIALPGGRRVRLDELAKVSDGAAEARAFARLDGRPVVAFSISRGRGYSDATVSKAVEAKIAELNLKRPDVVLSAIDSQVTYTVGNYESAMHTLVEGAVLAVLVVLVFLKDLRATLIAAVTLPLAIIPTFFFIDALGFSLNLVSLLAITLVSGILVDDAIVEIENIVRHARMGKSPYDAAMEAADEIGLAVIAITFTIVAVFAPVSFMPGIAGQYFKQFGLTVAIAVLVSLLVARLVTPVLAAYFLKDEAHEEERDGALMRGYLRVVAWAVRHRVATLVLGVGLFAGSMYTTRLLPSGFLPAEDVGRSILALELAPGARLQDTVEAADAVAAALRARPEVASVFVDGGRILGYGGKEVRKATVIVNLHHKSGRAATQKDLEAAIGPVVAAMPDLRSWSVKDNGQRDVQLLVTGTDAAGVDRAAADLAAAMRREVKEVANVVSTAAVDRPELRVIPRADVAADLGVTTEAIAEAVRVATLGDVGPLLPKFNAGDRLVPIRVQVDPAIRARADVIEALRVPTARGGSVPLGTVARIETDQGPASIERYDRQRRVAVEASLVGTAALGEALTAAKALPQARDLPAGVTLQEAGDAEVMGEVFSGFAAAMGAGIMMVYAVLVLLFGGFLQPLTILASLPLSVGGVVIALLVTGKAVSMPVVIGILMLMGIVTKNSIMLVDFAVEARALGMDRLTAAAEAGAKRARPIVMTTIAMAAGMLPSALALGDGGEFRAPMAIAVIGGLIVSTLLSLVFVPALYVLVDDLGVWLARQLKRLVVPRREPAPRDAPAVALARFREAAE